LETIKKEITDAEGQSHSYEIYKFTGLQGWNYQIRLGKILAPAIKEALSALPKGKLDKLLTGDIDPKLFGGAIDSFINALATNDAKGDFVAELLQNTLRDEKKLTTIEINTAYAGNYLEMMKAVIAVISSNSFFGLSNFGNLGDLINKTTK
jgi:hypothetical protein